MTLARPQPLPVQQQLWLGLDQEQKLAAMALRHSTGILLHNHSLHRNPWVGLPSGFGQEVRFGSPSRGRGFFRPGGVECEQENIPIYVRVGRGGVNIR